MTEIHVVRDGELVELIKSRDVDDLTEKHGDYLIHEKQNECVACSSIDTLEWAADYPVVTVVTFDDDMCYFFADRNPEQVKAFLLTVKATDAN